MLELAGWSTASDRFGAGPKANGAALAQAMQQAVERSGGLQPNIIYAGSYCTADADLAEAAAISGSFNGTHRPLVTNIRGTLGEAKGPTGLYNILAAQSSLSTGMVPGTSGCRELDPGCDIAVCTQATEVTGIQAVMCNSFWVNGTNASLIVRAPQ